MSTISSAIARIFVSCAPFVVGCPPTTERSGASGCGRRVSLKRRTSASWLASRKISSGFRPRHRLQPRADLRERRQEAALADVHDNRDLRRARRLLARDSSASVGNQLGRQVVDAEVAEILERANRLRLPRTRQPGEDDEAPVAAAAADQRAARSRRLHRRIHARSSACRVPAPVRSRVVLGFSRRPAQLRARAVTPASRAAW